MGSFSLDDDLVGGTSSSGSTMKEFLLFLLSNSGKEVTEDTNSTSSDDRSLFSSSSSPESLSSPSSRSSLSRMISSGVGTLATISFIRSLSLTRVSSNSRSLSSCSMLLRSSKGLNVSCLSSSFGKISSFLIGWKLDTEGELTLDFLSLLSSPTMFP